MDRYAHYTPMTDTVELAACHRGAPMHDVPTAQLWLMDLKPAVAPAPAKRATRLGRAARRAYTGLIGIGFAAIAALAVAPGALVELASLGH